MRWHSYQPLVLRARLNRDGRARPSFDPELTDEGPERREQEPEQSGSTKD